MKAIPAKDLKRGQLVWQAGMIMQFAYWQADTPVFSHFQKRGEPQINYINHKLTRESLIKIIKC